MLLNIISITVAVMGIGYSWYLSKKYAPIFYQVWGLFLSLAVNQSKYATAAQKVVTGEPDNKRLYERIHETYYTIQGLLSQCQAIGLSINKNKWNKTLKQNIQENMSYQEWLQKMTIKDKEVKNMKIETVSKEGIK